MSQAADFWLAPKLFLLPPMSNQSPMQEGEDGEDSEEQWVLERAEAGAVVSGLAVQLLDSTGAPVTQPVGPLT